MLIVRKILRQTWEKVTINSLDTYDRLTKRLGHDLRRLRIDTLTAVVFVLCL